MKTHIKRLPLIFNFQVSETQSEDTKLRNLDSRPHSELNSRLDPAMADMKSARPASTTPTPFNLPRSSTPLSSRDRSRYRQLTPRRTTTPDYKLLPYSPEPDPVRIEGVSNQREQGTSNLTAPLKRTFDVNSRSNDINNNLDTSEYCSVDPVIETVERNHDGHSNGNSQRPFPARSETDKHENGTDYRNIDLSPINGDTENPRVPPLDGSVFSYRAPVSARQLEDFEDDYEIKRFRKQESLW